VLDYLLRSTCKEPTGTGRPRLLSQEVRQSVSRQPQVEPDGYDVRTFAVPVGYSYFLRIE
jgi:hypothetical protein